MIKISNASSSIMQDLRNESNELNLRNWHKNFKRKSRNKADTVNKSWGWTAVIDFVDSGTIWSLPYNCAL